MHAKYCLLPLLCRQSRDDGLGVGGNEGLGGGMNVGITDGNSDVEDGKDVVDGLDVGELVIGE